MFGKILHGMAAGGLALLGTAWLGHGIGGAVDAAGEVTWSGIGAGEVGLGITALGAAVAALVLAAR